MLAFSAERRSALLSERRALVEYNRAHVVEARLGVVVVMSSGLNGHRVLLISNYEPRDGYVEVAARLAAAGQGCLFKPFSEM